MTDTQIDIIEIKQTLKDMQKNIAKIKQHLQDEYFDDKILDFYNTTDAKIAALLERRRQIDDEMNYFSELKNRNLHNDSVVALCDNKLKELLEEDIDVTLAIDNYQD